MEKADVLLTYAWVRSSYAALRSLTKLGLKVAVADTSKVGMGQWSRFSHFAGTVSNPLTHPAQFVTDINQLLQKTGATFLLPGHDETEVLAKHRHQLPPTVMLPIAEYEKIHHANDKSWTSAFAFNNGIPTPATIQWHNFSELKKGLARSNGPFVVKLRRGNSAKGVFYASTANDVQKLCEKLIEQYGLSPDRYPIIQERISGEGWGVSCLYWHGERIATFTHKRLREKTATGGTSTLRQSVRHPELERYAHKILDALSWHGLAMVEFKYDSVSNQGWFIEINPRLWGSIHLAIASGVDFPAMLYVAAMDGGHAARKMFRSQKEGIVARWYLGDLIIAASELKRFHFGKAIALTLLGGADTLDDWDIRDPMAFFGEAAYYLTNAIRYRNMNPIQEGMLG